MRRGLVLSLLAVAGAVVVLLLLRSAGSPSDATTDSASERSVSGTRPADLSRAPRDVVPVTPDREKAPRNEAPSGLSVVGTVVGGDGVPAADASVTVTVFRGHALVERVVARADAAGAYRAGLPATNALDDDARAVCTVSAIATAGARVSKSTARALHPAPAGDVVIDLALLPPGPTITGTVVDAAGLPLEGVSVVVCDGARFVATAPSDADGAFRARIETPGVYDVHVHDARHGVASVEGVRADTDAVSDVGRLVVLRSGIIEGRVELPDGSPAPRTTLSVGRTGTGPALPSWGCAPGGLKGRQLTSDDAGRFSVRDLAPGRYEIGPLSRDDRSVSVVEVETGATDVVVVVRRRVLVVRTVDAAGRPFVGASTSYEQVHSDGDFGGGAGDFAGGTADHVIDLSGPTRIRLQFSTPTLEADPLDVTVPPDRWRVDGTAVLRPPRPKGTIRVEVVDGSGGPIPVFHARAESITEPTSPLLGMASWSSDDSPRSKPLRPGAYTVEVAPGAAEWVSPDVGAVAFGSHRVVVTVVPGEEVVARFVARPGGWLRATVHLPSAGATLRGAQEVRRESDRARILSAWADPTLRGHFGGLSVGAPQFFGRALEPGRYLLALRANGAADAEVPFDIRAGETTEVEVTLKPE